MLISTYERSYVDLTFDFNQIDDTTNTKSPSMTSNTEVCAAINILIYK